MPVTFRGGRISSDNIVRSDGYTDRERAESISILPEDPRRQSQIKAPEGAGTLQEFMAASGRSDTNPYGDSGLFGGRTNVTNRMTPKQIADINLLAYNQYLGLASGRGNQRGGQGEFVPGYAPALKIGSNTPSGRVVAAPTQPEQGGGIADFFKLSPTLGILQSLFGRGNIPRTLDDGGVDYSTEGIETLNAAPVLKPGEAAPQPGEAQPSGFILASAQNRDNNKVTIPFLGKFLDFPRDGVGNFFNQNKDGIQLGPGKLRPEIKEDGFGLKYTIPISSQSVPDGGVTTPDGMNPFRDILQTPVINPDVPSNMPVISGENIEEYINRPLPGQERPMTPKMRRRMRFKSQFPAGV